MGSGLRFRSNAALEDFVSVMVDDSIVDQEQYDLREGSTIVTLKNEYLETLPAGRHTLSINSKTGTASAEFTIEKSTEPAKPEDTTSPEITDEEAEPVKTGDKTSMGLWIALMLASCCIVTVLRVSKRRRKAM